MQVIYYGLKNYIYQLVTPLQKPGRNYRGFAVWSCLGQRCLRCTMHAAACRLALQAFPIALFYLFLLCYKLTDSLKTSASLTLNFTFLFYRKLPHFSRM